ncbi:Zn-dependent hydrolase [Sulfobacillus thermosulfidooxidans]|uniref:Zn-dependent hydrolase n=1 Tax=Sulfobacillus thermosulfidooxidans TaxID=28034 RepID=UPI0003F8D34D|nr:Zn-dependent hydrolase [Sulfobacillus thermosulfidooxidans]
MMNTTRFWANFRHLQTIGKRKDGAYRVAWTEEDQMARQSLLDLLHREGLHAYQDGAGNIWGTWSPVDNAPYLVMGSHLDSVPSGGDFDGVFGVAAALESLLSLRDKAPDALCLNGALVAFADEEGVGFNSGLFGSRAVCGFLTREIFNNFHDDSGTRYLAETAPRFGVTWESVSTLDVIPIAVYLELHVEQGPNLDRDGIPIGVVDVITGRSQGFARFVGQQNHAGTTPMSLREDALLYAANAVISLNQIVGHRDAVGTIGQLKAMPGSPNVIAASASISFDVRSPSDAVRNKVVSDWINSWHGGTLLSYHEEAAVPLYPAIQDVIARAALKAGLKAMTVPSWAVHDAMIMAKKVPTGLIFIPSVQGISHAAEEWSHPQSCEWGVRVLEDTARMLLAPDGEYA